MYGKLEENKLGKSNGFRNVSVNHPRILNQAYLNEMIHKAGVLPLRRDFGTLLTYVRDNKVVGTQSTGNMPLKSVREVTAKFVDPPVLDTTIGDHVHKLRSEEDVWDLYFLHILAETGNLLTTHRAKKWRLKKMGNKFLGMNELQQVVYLLSVWWYQVDWLVAYPLAGMGDNLPINFSLVTLMHLDVLPMEKAIRFEIFADSLIKDTNLKWHSESQNFAAMTLRGSIQQMVVKVLKKFGVLETEYIEKPLGNSTIKELEAFKINRFGKELMESLKMMGAGSI